MNNRKRTLGLKLGKIFAKVGDDCEMRFRQKVLREYGAAKGSFGRCLEMAMELWLERE